MARRMYRQARRLSSSQVAVAFAGMLAMSGVWTSVVSQLF